MEIDWNLGIHQDSLDHILRTTDTGYLKLPNTE